MKAILKNQQKTFSEHFDFGETDSKGRKIGAVANTYEADVVDAGDSNYYYTSFDSEGHYFGVRVQATRNAKSFGASQPIKWFSSKAEALDHMAARISSSQKQAINKGKAA